MDDTTEPDWGYEDCKYAVQFKGLPSFRVSYEPTEPGPDGDIGYWGRIWTAMSVVNAIPTVVAAPPGIRTHLDLPLGLHAEPLWRPGNPRARVRDLGLTDY